MPSHVLSPAQWAVVIEREARKLKRERKLRRLPTAREIAEGVGIVQAESGGNASEQGGAGGASGHIGGWQEEASYGTKRERLSAGPASASALLHWQSSGFSWGPDWGRWELEQGGHSGASDWKHYLAAAVAAIGGKGPEVNAARAAATSPTAPAPSGEASAGASSLTTSLRHDGLILLLVLGGALLVFWGLTRMLGAARRPA